MIRSIRLTLALVACALLPVLPVGASLVVCLPKCGHWTVGVAGGHHHCACHEAERAPASTCCDHGCGHDARGEDHDVADESLDACPCDCQDVPIETVDSLVTDGSKGDRDPIVAAASRIVCAVVLPTDTRTAARPAPHPSPPSERASLRTTVLRL